MTVNELAKQLSRLITRGGGDMEIAVFQWEHGREMATDAIANEEAGLLEFYTGPAPAEDDFDDLI